MLGFCQRGELRERLGLDLADTLACHVEDEPDFLDAEMRQVAEVVHRTDMDQLLAHKRFLADRFRRNATGD